MKRFVAVLTVAFSLFFLPGCKTGVDYVPPTAGELHPAAEEECTLPPNYVMGLPIRKAYEEETAPFRAQAVYGTQLSDGTIVAVLLYRPGCHEEWEVQETAVIPPECPPDQCI